jgi:glutamine kinase
MTKSLILKKIKSKLTLFSIPDFVVLQVIKYSKKDVINISKRFKNKKLAIRSSASGEDSIIESLAGEYDSLLNVDSNNTNLVSEGIDRVIRSYGRKKNSTNELDHVMVQEMVLNTTMSGVVFTHDLNTGAPYYVINYDDQSGLTDTVTSGSGEYANRTLYVHRDSIDSLKSERFTRLLLAVQELEVVMESQFLDIEFALGEGLTPHLLQVRAITTHPNWNRSVTKHINETLQGLQKFVIHRLKKLTGVYGRTTVLGQMPDWNPVEMIGRAPRRLSASLYQKLITDSVWRVARSIMGYSVPCGQPLMVTLAGQPFIDTRLSFHSYIPKSTPSVVAEKLVDHWVEKLKSYPELHDKVEFRVAITTYSFDFDKKVEDLIGDVLNSTEKKEFKRAHLEQTMRLIKGDGKGSIDKALNKIKTLEAKQESYDCIELQDNISFLFTMIDDCINLGTIPFSILARHGFIAQTILLSLNQQGVITHDEIVQIQASVKTVASELVDDINLFQLGPLSRDEFMKKYGHLRPGTYDIMSQRYDKMDNLSITNNLKQKKQPFKEFAFTQIQQDEINNLLRKDGFNNFSASDLLSYIKQAIYSREYSKFIFTRTVSDMLELIASFAENNNLSRDEISHVSIDFMLDMTKNSNINNIEDLLRKVSEKGVEKHNVSAAIRLPQLLTDKTGVYVIPFQVSHPNFITHKKVIAQCAVLESDTDKLSLNKKIVLIEGADPGYDWIFSHNIAGLITKYGGVNSHMTIRCAEFGIPAAIGCGEQRFNSFLRSNRLHLDCAAGLIKPLH